MKATFPGIAVLVYTLSGFGLPSASPASLSDEVDVSGTWDVTVESPQGKGNPTLSLQQDGEKLTGTYKGRFGESKLAGSVRGDEIRFSFTLSLRDQPVTITYTGKVGRDEMSGTVQFGDLSSGTWKAKRKKD